MRRKNIRECKSEVVNTSAPQRWSSSSRQLEDQCVCVCDREFKDKSVSVCWSQTKGFCVQQIINITIILIFFFFKLKKKTHVTDPSNNAFQHHILKYVCCSVFNHSHSQCPDRSA